MRVVLAILFLLSGPGFAAPTLHIGEWRTLVSLEKEIDLRELLPVVGAVDAREESGSGHWGNGAFVAPRYFVTAAHVIEGTECENIAVRTMVSGRVHLGGQLRRSKSGVRVTCVEIVVQDKERDIALIEVSPPVGDYLKWDEGEFRMGEKYTAFGYLASGYVSLVKGIELLGSLQPKGNEPFAAIPKGTCSIAGCSTSRSCTLDSGGWFDGFAEKGLSGSPLLRRVDGQFKVAGVLSGILAEKSSACLRSQSGETVDMIPDNFVRPPLQYISVRELFEHHPQVRRRLQDSVKELPREEDTP